MPTYVRVQILNYWITNLIVSCLSDKPKNITISCQRHFSNDTFTIISSFKLSDYIIKENVIDVIHIEPMLVAYTDVSKMHQVTMERMTDIQLEDIPVQV